MRTILTIILAAICIGVLISGQLHWKNMNKAVSQEASIVAHERMNKEKKEIAALMKQLDPEENPEQPIVDFLQYKALTKGNVVIAVVGGSATAGIGASHYSKSWPELLKKGLRNRNENLDSLKLVNHGHEGYSTSDLINGEKIALLIKDQPDLVIFENTMISNYVQAISLEQTAKDLEKIMESIRAGLPHAKIMMMSPNPIVNQDNKNNLGLSYADYIQQSEAIIARNQWTYINSIIQFDKMMADENALLADIMTGDQVHVNDDGHYLWSEILLNYLMNEL